MFETPRKISVSCDFNVVADALPQNNGRFFGLAKRYDNNNITIQGDDNWLSDFKPNVIYDYYSKNKSIEKTLEAMKNDNLNVPSEINYQDTKKYFLNPKVKEVTKEDLILQQPQIDSLMNKLVNNYGLIKYLIKSKLDKINKFYEKLKDF